MNNDFLNDELSEKELTKAKNIIINMSNEDFINEIKRPNKTTYYNNQIIYIHKTEMERRFVNWILYYYKRELIDILNKNKQLDSKKVKILNNIITRQKQTSGYYYRIRIIIKTINYHLSNLPNVNNVNSITVSFNIKTSKTSNKTTYAFLYSKPSLQYDDISKSKDIYICIGPSLLSSDGEYRSKFIDIKTFNELKLVYNKLWNRVENYLINKPGVTFTQDFYFPKPFIYHKEYKKNVDNNRYAINLYIISWLSQGILKYLKLQNKHIDSMYNINMFDTTDDIFIKGLVDEYKITYLKLFYMNAGQMLFKWDKNITKYKIPVLPHAYTGQKIIPIQNNDSININNIKINAYRELYISKKVSDLVINNICNGFSVFYTWFKINNIDKKLFNNTNIWKAFNKKNKLNAITLINEHVGRTINDIENLYKSKTYKKTNTLLFNHLETFNTYIFNIIYSLYCLNSKLNIIHGDLHLNNTTMHQIKKKYLYDIFPKYIKTPEIDRHLLYIIDGDIFIQKNKHKIGTIIDFSRSFIIPEEKEHYLYFKDIQSKRILNYYENLFPTFIKKYKKQLMFKLDNEFKCVYKIFTAIDVYMHTNELIKYINYHKLDYIKPVMDLLINVKDKSKYHLTNNMKIILLEKNTDINNIIFPNYDIIMKCFSNCKISNKQLNDEKLFVDDIFIFDRIMKYSINSYEKLPNRIKYKKIKKTSDQNINDVYDMTNEMPTATRNINNFYGKTPIFQY